MIANFLRSVAIIAALQIAASAAYAQTRFLGLEPGVAPAIRKSTLIVFVHGVIGNKETWLSPSGRSWPEIVSNDDMFKDADILVYEYPSPKLWASYSIGGLADRLATDLKNYDIGVMKYPRVVFVTHSLGGIVVRKMLLDAEDDLRNKVDGIFLFGTPMGGSIYANWFKLFSNNRQVIQLEKTADPDRITNTVVKDWINKRLEIRSFCAFELATPVVVERWSAQPLCNSALRELNVNHFDLVKPADQNTDQHRLLREWYSLLFQEHTHVNLEEEKAAQIVVASCSGDRNYTNKISGTLKASLDGLHGERARVSATLPSDWTSPWYKSLLWKKTEPKVLVIHFSCFERDQKRTDSIADRDRDFGSLLEALKDDRVKIAVFSRVFTGYPKHLAGIIEERGLKAAYKGRLVTLAVDQRELVGVDNRATDQLKKVVSKLLN